MGGKRKKERWGKEKINLKQRSKLQIKKQESKECKNVIKELVLT